MERPPSIIVGLGNPGERYARTRHNVGFMVADLLARRCGLRKWRAECQALVGECEIEGRRVVLAKPLTFMNLSGCAMRELLERHQATTESVVIVLDDVNLLLGRIRIRARGSAGGHHGLESVARYLGTEEFVRVRVGVGEESLPPDVAGFVLTNFPSESEEKVKEMVVNAGDAVKTILTEGIAKAMSVFNTVKETNL